MPVILRQLFSEAPEKPRNKPLASQTGEARQSISRGGHHGHKWLSSMNFRKVLRCTLSFLAICVWD